jgi:O-antigen biosynthesis protein
LADALMRQNWADGAIVFYQMALQIRPDDKAISGLLEEVLKKKGVSRTAAKSGVGGYSESAIEENPGVATEYHELGESLAVEGKFSEAIAAYRKAISINPNYFGTYHNLGDILRSSGKVDEAIQSYRKATALNPTFVWSHHNLGDLFQQENRLDEAIASYQKAIEVI